MTLDEMLELQSKTNAKFDSLLTVYPCSHYGFPVIPYPYVDQSAGSKPRLAAVRIFNVTGGSAPHTVVLSATKENGKVSFGVWCGDSYLEGRGGMARVLDVIPQIHPKLSDRNSVISRLESAHSMAATSGRCNFWPAWKAGKGGCKHVATVLAVLGSSLKKGLIELERELLRMLGDVAQIHAEKPTELSPALRWLNSLYETPIYS